MVTADRHQNTTVLPPLERIIIAVHQNNLITNNMSQNLSQLHQQLNATASTKTVDASKEANKSAVSQRSVDIKISKESTATQEITKKILKLDLISPSEIEDIPIKSPKSPVAVRIPHQTSLTSSVDVEDRKTLREALYQGIFHRHRRTIFAVGSFLRMLRSRNSQYNSIRSSSEGEDMDEVR